MISKLFYFSFFREGRVKLVPKDPREQRFVIYFKHLLAIQIEN